MSRENAARIIAGGQIVAKPDVLKGKCFQTLCFETKCFATKLRKRKEKYYDNKFC
jgi:hypothetical protein